MYVLVVEQKNRTIFSLPCVAEYRGRLHVYESVYDSTYDFVHDLQARHLMI
jgi:hypothetical protein